MTTTQPVGIMSAADLMQGMADTLGVTITQAGTMQEYTTWAETQEAKKLAEWFITNMENSIGATDQGITPVSLKEYLAEYWQVTYKGAVYSPRVSTFQAAAAVPFMYTPTETKPTMVEVNFDINWSIPGTQSTTKDGVTVTYTPPSIVPQPVAPAVQGVPPVTSRVDLGVTAVPYTLIVPEVAATAGGDAGPGQDGNFKVAPRGTLRRTAPRQRQDELAMSEQKATEAAFTFVPQDADESGPQGGDYVPIAAWERFVRVKAGFVQPQPYSHRSRTTDRAYTAGLGGENARMMAILTLLGQGRMYTKESALIDEVDFHGIAVPQVSDLSTSLLSQRMVNQIVSEYTEHNAELNGHCRRLAAFSTLYGKQYTPREIYNLFAEWLATTRAMVEGGAHARIRAPEYLLGSAQERVAHKFSSYDHDSRIALTDRAGKYAQMLLPGTQSVTNVTVHIVKQSTAALFTTQRMGHGQDLNGKFHFRGKPYGVGDGVDKRLIGTLILTANSNRATRLAVSRVAAEGLADSDIKVIAQSGSRLPNGVPSEYAITRYLMVVPDGLYICFVLYDTPVVLNAARISQDPRVPLSLPSAVGPYADAIIGYVTAYEQGLIELRRKYGADSFAQILHKLITVNTWVSGHGMPLWTPVNAVDICIDLIAIAQRYKSPMLANDRNVQELTQEARHPLAQGQTLYYARGLLQEEINLDVGQVAEVYMSIITLYLFLSRMHTLPTSGTFWRMPKSSRFTVAEQNQLMDRVQLRKAFTGVSEPLRTSDGDDVQQYAGPEHLYKRIAMIVNRYESFGLKVFKVLSS